MSKRILALVSATLMACSSFNHLEETNVFKGELIKQEQVSIGKTKRYDEFLEKYDKKLEEIELQKQRELEEQKRREEEKINKVKNLDRGYAGTYRILEVNCIVSYYTNQNNSLEGGSNDCKGKPLVSHDMNVVAAPSNIPYGSFVELEGMGIYKVVDRGGAIKWINNNTMKIDVFVPNATTPQLNKLGVKKTSGKIYIKE